MKITLSKSQWQSLGKKASTEEMVDENSPKLTQKMKETIEDLKKIANIRLITLSTKELLEPNCLISFEIKANHHGLWVNEMKNIRNIRVLWAEDKNVFRTSVYG